MNILPLVLALLLILSVLTVEKWEKFKSLLTVQKEYQIYLAESDRRAFNKRQKNLLKENRNTSQRQLSFQFFYKKNLRDDHPEKFKQVRLIVVELIRILYGEAAFFKEIESKRPKFIDELLEDFMAAADRIPVNRKIKRIEDIQSIRLSDPDLQEAYYRMMKGTITKDKLNQMKEQKALSSSGDRPLLSPREQEKCYFSLLNFIKHEENQKVVVQLASRELLTAIFVQSEIVEAIIVKRNELDSKKTPDAAAQFANEFKGKQRPGISDELLDFSISQSDKSSYD